MYEFIALLILIVTVAVALGALVSTIWAHAKGREPFLNYRGVVLTLLFLLASTIWRGNLELPAIPGAVTSTLVYAYIWAAGAFLTMGYLALRLLITEDTDESKAEQLKGYAKSIGLFVAATGFALSIVAQRAADAQLSEIASLVQIDQLRAEDAEIQKRLAAEAMKLDVTCAEAQSLLAEMEKIEALVETNAQFSWLSINESQKIATTDPIIERLKVCTGSRQANIDRPVIINGCVIGPSENEIFVDQSCESNDRAIVETLATWQALRQTAATTREEISTLTKSDRTTESRDTESVRNEIERNAFLSTFLLPMVTFGGIGLEFAFLFLGAPRRRQPQQSKVEKAQDDGQNGGEHDATSAELNV